MPPRIGMIGVPIEDVPIQDAGILIPAFLPHITDRLRGAVISEAYKYGIQIVDLGEVNLGQGCNLGFYPDRVEGVSPDYNITMWNIKELEKERRRVLTLSRLYDLIVGIGPSHSGAIVLYEKGDVTSRYDYHSDCGDERELPKGARFAYNCGNYMNWVKERLMGLTVGNYYVKCLMGGICGRILADDDNFGEHAKYHDIDSDCFGLWIQNVYPPQKRYGPPSGNPYQVLSFLRAPKPDKLGIWEYRSTRDPSRQGIPFIVSAIANSVGVDIENNFCFP